MIVSPDGAIVGEGAHEAPGQPHAEVVAIAQAGEKARGATLYVTLEPCVHHGRTPPCTDAILEAGIAAVRIAVEDPDEKVSGSGTYILKQAGLEVEVGLESAAARALDPGYFHHRETGRSWVTMKWAMTLDGSIAAQDRSSKWITGEEAREDAHRLRASMDAILVGAGTLRADDPMLDVRLDDFQGDQPRPVIVAGRRDLPERARVWERNPLVVAAHEVSIPSGEMVVVAGDGAWPYPELVAELLADRGLIDVLVEGGAELIGSWLRAGVMSRGVLYLAGRLGGGKGLQPVGGEFGTILESREVSIVDVRKLGEDLRIDYE